MRVAFCLVGIVGSSNFGMGLGKPIDFRLGHHFHKKHILDNNDVDVFIHSWSTQYKYGIINSYKPKKHLVEEQKVFDAVGTNELGSLRKEKISFFKGLPGRVAAQISRCARPRASSRCARLRRRARAAGVRKDLTSFGLGSLSGRLPQVLTQPSAEAGAGPPVGRP